jgi:ABC-type uncharacterized transport system fused permease/ATPase subunit
VRKVLIVDDEPSVRFVLGQLCKKAGVPHVEAASAEEARAKLASDDGGSRDGIGLVLLDVRLPGDDGLTLLGELSVQPRSPFVVVMTAEDTMRSAVEAMKRGAADYLGKPFDLARVERLVRDLAIGPEPEPAGRNGALGPESAGAGALPAGEGHRELSISDLLIGRSPAMVEVYKEIGRVARTEMTVLLMGESGTGKSTLIRAIAGLWPWGSGRVLIPAGSHIAFLPQRPYMILSNLRSQLLYPRGRKELTDAALQDILEQVFLPDLLEKHGGLEAVRDWSKVLSLGEQQRIAFARVLICGAKYVFLDEATSAMDVATEAAVYLQLRKAGTTYVSVGHRETLLHFHDQALCLYPGGRYRLTSAASLSTTAAGDTPGLQPAHDGGQLPG